MTMAETAAAADFIMAVLASERSPGELKRTQKMPRTDAKEEEDGNF